MTFWHWIIDDENLTRPEKFMCLVLVRHVNKSGECWPSIERLCALSSYDVRHVRRILRTLEAKGYLESTARTGSTTVYKLREVATQRKLLDLPTKTVVGHCYLCQLPIYAGEPTEIDHVIPRSFGGKNRPENKRRVHRDCNQTKKDSVLRADISGGRTFQEGGHFDARFDSKNVPQKPVIEAVKDKTPRSQNLRAMHHRLEREAQVKIETLAGSNGICAPVRVRPEVLERIRKREARGGAG